MSLKVRLRCLIRRVRLRILHSYLFQRRRVPSRTRKRPYATETQKTKEYTLYENLIWHQRWIRRVRKNQTTCHVCGSQMQFKQWKMFIKAQLKNVIVKAIRNFNRDAFSQILENLRDIQPATVSSLYTETMLLCYISKKLRIDLEYVSSYSRT